MFISRLAGTAHADAPLFAFRGLGISLLRPFSLYGEAPVVRIPCLFAAMVLAAGGLSACADNSLPEAPATLDTASAAPAEYLIGAGDTLHVFVWHSPELTTTVRVRPDGLISVPLANDVAVGGKTPTAVARELEARLAEYVNDPKVNVIVQDFIGRFDRQIRVVGEAAKPQAIPYRQGMTVLDVVIAAGGLTRFADGNGATLVRTRDRHQTSYRVRLADLIEGGDLHANVPVAPGDLLLIPQNWF